MTQGLVYIIIILGCTWLILDEFWGKKRITEAVGRMFQ